MMMYYLAGALIRDHIDYRARPNLKKIEHEHHYYGLIPPRLILAQSTTVDTHQTLIKFLLLLQDHIIRENCTNHITETHS